MSALGQADMYSAIPNVRFTPKADRYDVDHCAGAEAATILRHSLG